MLLRGQAVLFTRPDGGRLQAVEMKQGLIYNVPAGVWHNLVATRDVSFLIVENRDTHLHDTEIRPITAQELAALGCEVAGMGAGLALLPGLKSACQSLRLQ